MRTFLAALALMAFAAVPAFAVTISVDGSDTDWVAAGLLHSDNIAPKTSYCTMVAYGATIQNGMFYGIVEGAPTDTYHKAYPQAWLNVDQNVGTFCGNPDGIVGGKGFDIDLEMDINDPANGSQYNFWGYNDDIQGGFQPGGVPGGASARIGNVFEFSAPVSLIQARVATTGAGTNPDAGIRGVPVAAITQNWTVYMALDSTSVNPDSDWGRNIVTDAGALTVATPEPGTLAMLIGAGLALLGYALRRRS